MLQIVPHCPLYFTSTLPACLPSGLAARRTPWLAAGRHIKHILRSKGYYIARHAVLTGEIDIHYHNVEGYRDRSARKKVQHSGKSRDGGMQQYTRNLLAITDGGISDKKCHYVMYEKGVKSFFFIIFCFNKHN